MHIYFFTMHTVSHLYYNRVKKIPLKSLHDLFIMRFSVAADSESTTNNLIPAKRMAQLYSASSVGTFGSSENYFMISFSI